MASRFLICWITNRSLAFQPSSSLSLKMMARADIHALPRQIGGNNEIGEIFHESHLQGAYIRATAFQRPTGNRYIIFQRNNAAVISAPTNAYTVANLIQVINQCFLPGTTVVLKDYGMYGGKDAVQQQFQQQFPNTAVCTLYGFHLVVDDTGLPMAVFFFSIIIKIANLVSPYCKTCKFRCI